MRTLTVYDDNRQAYSDGKSTRETRREIVEHAAESLKLPPQPPITTRVNIQGFEAAKLRAFAHHRTQTQEWEPLQKFIEGQGTVEVFSLVGAAHDLDEDDLFSGVEI